MLLLTDRAGSAGSTAAEVLEKVTTAPVADTRPLRLSTAPVAAPPLVGCGVSVSDWRDGGRTVIWVVAE